MASGGARFSQHYTVVPGAVLLLALPWLWMVDNGLQAALLVTQLLLCTFGIVSSYVTGLRPVRLVFFSFVFSWLGVGPLYQVSHRQLAWQDSDLLNSTDMVTAALGLTVLFTAAVSAAMWQVGTRAARTPPPRTMVVPREWAPWGFLGALVAITPYVVATNGGVGSFFASRQDRVSELMQGGVSLAGAGGASVALAQIVPAALAVATAHLFILHARRTSTGEGWTTTALPTAAGLGAALSFVVLYANPLSNTRFISIAAFGSLAFAIVRPRSPRAGQWIAVLLSVLTLAVYPLSYLLAPEAPGAGDRSSFAVFGSQDFDGFQQIVNSLIYVQDHGYNLGRYTVSALLFFIPRAVWPWKATPSSIDVAANRDYWFTNLSMPVHAEVFLDVGLIGMLIFGFVLGHAWARIDHAWLTSPASLGAWLAPFLAMAQLGFIRGPLGSLSPIWLTVTVLLLVGVRRVPVDVAPEAAPAVPPAGDYVITRAGAADTRPGPPGPGTG
ncbi:hypothetical protein E4P40_09980 [Blastococcus sp. CT_GayMR20]|uniref:hypothetical protein n=1 Tax=Blastococcus sp. CT_GayMR20 TaxID=2559609 RepID=UPI0010741BF6|nr:hypothetical protein [Blastococcus sp. CT_GayMR20]TFV88386.1 hypothetical protein E4P40_09980 [Blastococcus sp. CT_GayMR20]